MHILTIDKIKKIEKEVMLAEISFSHLPEDLIDHLCCDVENEMNKGASFEHAFKKVKEKIGIGGLKRIEEHTLLFINLNYVIMKKLMIIFSIVSTASILTSGFFKVFHLPGANVLFTLGMLVLIVGFIPVLFLTRNKEDKERKYIWVNITGYIASTVFSLSIVFSLMHWLGANFLLLITWITVIFVFLPAYLFSIIKSSTKEKLFTHIGVALMITILVIIDAVIFLNSKRADYLNYSTIANNVEEMIDFYELKNKNLYNEILIDTSTDKVIKEKVTELVVETSKIKEELNGFASDINNINDFRKLRIKDNFPVGFHNRINHLRDITNEYKQFISPYISDNEKLNLIVNETLETKKIGNTPVYNLYFQIPLIIIRNNLYRLERDILLIEYEILGDLSTRPE